MIRQHCTTAAVVLTLGLTASLAPSASADPAPLARAEAAMTATQPSPPVQPNADEQTGNAANTHSGPCSEVCSRGAASHAAAEQHSNGFNWDDAGIGAAGMLALTLIAFAATVSVTHRRHHRPREQQTSWASR